MSGYFQTKEQGDLNTHHPIKDFQHEISQKISLPNSKLDIENVSRDLIFTKKDSMYKNRQNPNPKISGDKSKNLMITLFSRENPNFRFENFKTLRPNHRSQRQGPWGRNDSSGVFSPPKTKKSCRNFDKILGDFGLKTVKSVDEKQWGFAVDQHGVIF